MLNDDKYIEEAEGRGDGHAKVTCNDARGMIAKKGGPALRLAAFAWATENGIKLSSNCLLY